MVVIDLKVKIHNFTTCSKLTDLRLIFNLIHQVTLRITKKGLFHFVVTTKLTTLDLKFHHFILLICLLY